MNYRKVWLSVGLAISMLSEGCNRSQVVAPPQPVLTVVADSAQLGDGLRYSASVLPDAQVDLTFRVGGYVQTIRQVKGVNGRLHPIETGDYVEAGTVLATLRPTDYKARAELSKGQLQEAKAAQIIAQAQLDEANANLEEARTNFGRAQVLFDDRAMTKPEYDDAKSALERAEARVAAARSQITVQQARIEQAGAGEKEAENALADVDLRAPFSGVLVARNVELGSLATAGTNAFVIADIHTVKVEFGVPDVSLRSFSLGQEAPVTTEAVPGKVFRGRISSLSPTADSSSRAYRVQVAVSNPDGVLKPGMIAAIEMENGMRSAPAPEVPLSAVVRTASSNGYGVFVLESKSGNTVARLRPVVLGQVNGRQIVVQQGVAPGEHIVKDGGVQLVDGETVREIR